MKYRADIDGLRAVAIVPVVLYHAGVPGFSGGYVGVDVFFVISGFLIIGILAREIEETGRIAFLEFYARRGRRLLPAALTTIAATLVVGLAVLSPFEMKDLAKTSFASSLYLGNFWFAWQASDYFSREVALNPLVHMWSLAVEEQFYLIAPAILLGLFTITRSRRTISLIVLALSVASFAASVWLTIRMQPFAFYSSPTRAWEFGVGAMVALATPSLSRFSRSLLGVVSAGALFAYAAFVTVEIYPGWWALIPVFATAGIIVSGQDMLTGHLLSTAPMRTIGGLSYSWYLWHWPVLVFAGIVWPDIGTPMRIGCVVGALGLAWITHNTLENPVRYSRSLIPRAALSLILAAALTLFGLALSAGVYSIAVAASNTPFQRQIALAINDWRRGCNATLSRTEPLICELGDLESRTTIILFGDSHAAQWLPAADEASRAKGWHLVTMIKNSCPTANVMVHNIRLHRDFTECNIWRDKALDKITALHPNLVIMANFTFGYVRSAAWGGWGRGLLETASVFDGAGIPTLLLQDTPNAGFDVAVCLSRIGHPTTECNLTRSAAVNEPASALEIAAVSSIALLKSASFTNDICDENDCPAIKDGLIVYRDNHHLSKQMVERLSDRFAEVVSESLTAHGHTN